MSVYALADLHGRLDLYKQVKDFIKPKDTVFFLGDAGDRGPEPWETIKAIYNDPQFIYLKGNHEDMLINSFRGHLDDIALCEYNGGAGTRRQLGQEPDAIEWVHRLDQLPDRKIYYNEKGQYIMLCHAGFTPSHEHPFGPSKYDILWDRDHFYNAWPQSYDNTIIVHGHTPIPYLINKINEYCEFFEGHAEDYIWQDWNGGALWYATSHKVCVDCGSAYTDCCVLLNLNTWDELLFQGPNFNEKELRLEEW